MSAYRGRRNPGADRIGPLDRPRRHAALINLAHGIFLIAGAYAGFLLLQATGLDPLLTLVVTAVLIGAVALPIERFLLQPLAKYGAEAPMMTTFGLAIVLENLFGLEFSADTRSIETGYAAVPLQIGPISVPLIYLICFAISVCVILIVHVVVLGGMGNILGTLVVADRACVLEHGRIALSGSAAQIRSNPRLRELYLGGAQKR